MSNTLGRRYTNSVQLLKITECSAVLANGYASCNAHAKYAFIVKDGCYASCGIKRHMKQMLDIAVMNGNDAIRVNVDTHEIVGVGLTSESDPSEPFPGYYRRASSTIEFLNAEQYVVDQRRIQLGESHQELVVQLNKIRTQISEVNRQMNELNRQQNMIGEYYDNLCSNISYCLEPTNLINDDVCAICISSMTDDGESGALPECGHMFHNSCIHKWFQSRKTCPCCRKRIDLRALQRSALERLLRDGIEYLP